MKTKSKSLTIELLIQAHDARIYFRDNLKNKYCVIVTDSETVLKLSKMFQLKVI